MKIRVLGKDLEVSSIGLGCRSPDLVSLDACSKTVPCSNSRNSQTGTLGRERGCCESRTFCR